MFNGAVAQPLQNWFLRGLSLAQQGLIDVASLLSFSRQTRRAAQVGLVSEHNEKFSLLIVSSVFHHPRRNLVRYSESVRWRTGRNTSYRDATLADNARGGDGSYGSDNSCGEEQ